MTAGVLSTMQFPLTGCCSMPMVRLSMVVDNDGLPRCAGCGHRKTDPETGVHPVQTRQRGPVAWATELLNRARARAVGRSL